MTFNDQEIREHVRVLLNDVDAFVWNNIRIDQVMFGINSELQAIIAKTVAANCAAQVGNLEYAGYLAGGTDLKYIIESAVKVLCEK